MQEGFWPLIAIIGEYLIRLGMVVVVLLRERGKPAATLAWIVLILAVPLVGAGAYLLVGGVRLGRRRIMRHRQIIARIDRAAEQSPPDRPSLETRIDPAYRQIATLAESVGGTMPHGGHRLELIGETDRFIEALVQDIDAARDHCHLTFYIYMDDVSGTRVAEALLRAASRGVTCRLLVDAVGSRGFCTSRLRQQLQTGGVAVVEALPANALRMLFARLDLRNHRKLAIIDGQIGYLGSQNIADASFASKKRFGPWVDAMVRVAGPIVRDLQVLFVQDWFLDTDESLDEVLSIQPAADADGVTVQVMGTGPNSFNEALRQLTQSAFHVAREELILTTPYFVPGEATVIALEAAAGRGARTILLVPARNDSRLVAAASRSHYQRLLESGVQIQEYHRGMLHAKTMTIDRDLAMISSANLDRRSFDLNFEVSMVVYDSDFASSLRFLQQSYLEGSTAIATETWARRPLPVRLCQNAAGALSPLL